MEFLVEIEVEFPPDLPTEQLKDIIQNEATRGQELKQAGTIARIWRIPGRRANVGVWVGADADEVHRAITSLPAFPWINARVTALATHPLESRD
jgi:muconolactone D-isomerase